MTHAVPRDSVMSDILEKQKEFEKTNKALQDLFSELNATLHVEYIRGYYIIVSDYGAICRFCHHAHGLALAHAVTVR